MPNMDGKYLPRGDGPHYSVQLEDFIKLFGDILRSVLYGRLRVEKQTIGSDLVYADNGSFWQDALAWRHRPGLSVDLEGFHLTEWLPLSPGRYFTPEACKAREDARDWYSDLLAEYTPEGKGFMVLGGLGTLRLLPRQIGSRTIYLLGASSTGVCHQGIPVALPAEEYRKTMPFITRSGGCVADLRGHIEAFPELALPIRPDPHVPKYYFLADHVAVHRQSRPKELVATAAIMFGIPNRRSAMEQSGEYVGGGYATHLSKRWSFCSFCPAPSEGNSLAEAVKWLTEYSIRCSDVPNPPILSDFDEHISHFCNPVEFPIKETASGVIDRERLSVYGDYYGFRVGGMFSWRVAVSTLFTPQ